MYSYHILLLPAAVTALVIAHVLLVRRHGVVPPFALQASKATRGPPTDRRAPSGYPATASRPATAPSGPAPSRSARAVGPTGVRAHELPARPRRHAALERRLRAVRSRQRARDRGRRDRAARGPARRSSSPPPTTGRARSRSGRISSPSTSSRPPAPSSAARAAPPNTGRRTTTTARASRSRSSNCRNGLG